MIRNNYGRNLKVLFLNDFEDLITTFNFSTVKNPMKMKLIAFSMRAEITLPLRSGNWMKI
tara:strand:- start:336 stop:515 length:180 start_codon:yes stop_codon:yes gene_type:complete